MTIGTAEQKKLRFSDFTEEEIAILSAIPDTAKIRNHLERYGSITALEANELYGIQRLAAEIYKLRYKKEPLMNITSVRQSGKDRFNQEANFVRYFYEGE